MKYEIKHRFTGAVIYTADIEADENTPRASNSALRSRRLWEPPPT